MAASKKKGKTAATKSNEDNVSESKAEKFQRLGAMRATKAINAMRGIRKLANKHSYEYTPEQVDKLVKALKAEVEGVFDAFNKKGAEKASGFEF